MTDLVYLWCDDGDAGWCRKRDAALAKSGRDPISSAACRYRGGDMIRYSLRSAAMNASWIRRVFIVVDDCQAIPDDAEFKDGKVVIVRHSEIIPEALLPTFNSVTVEHFLWNIPGLADSFLLANDDTFFWRPVTPSFFFAADGYPIFRFGARRAKVADWLYRDYHETLLNSERLVESAFGKVRGFRYSSGRLPHHNVDAYLTQDYRECHRRFETKIVGSIRSPFRTTGDIQRVLYADYALAAGHGHFRRATFNTGSGSSWLRRMLPAWADSLQIVSGSWRQAPDLIERFNPSLVCFNDGPLTGEDDFTWLRNWLVDLFPVEEHVSSPIDSL